MSTASLVPYRYELDARDEIVSVDDAWLAFALENGADQLTRDAVVGRSLWDFVVGDATRELYTRIFERVRTCDTPVLIPFRCDSPECRRYMRLDISHVTGGRLRLDGVIMRMLPRIHLTILGARGTRSRVLLPICSFCKRVSHEGEWIELEDAVVRLRLFSEAERPNLSHVACPTCQTVVREQAGLGAP